ncbi:hypothetical protein LZ30DRAFT_699495 [Colletotrichum cereale]|nr:hypothetical protein LZ30DRAFT_699495 [Colletotrichum cereale]
MGKGAAFGGSSFIPTHADDPAMSRAGPYLTNPPGSLATAADMHLDRDSRRSPHPRLASLSSIGLIP